MTKINTLWALLQGWILNLIVHNIMLICNILNILPWLYILNEILKFSGVDTVQLGS